MKDPRVDAYIASAPAFAKPILKELRQRVHAAAPGVSETIKWNVPFFEYGGKLLGGMSAFKQHCAFGFWHPMMRDGDTSLEGMGQYGKIASIADLRSSSAFDKRVKKAMKLVDDGVKAPSRPRAKKKEIAVPPELAAALKKNAKARATFEGFPYGKRNEYVKWIREAKREETRAQRIVTTVTQLAEGKSLYWKYETC
jgi:uncharacterized protein YdeI (YjbR/CyaY-like superfamily)